MQVSTPVEPRLTRNNGGSTLGEAGPKDGKHAQAPARYRSLSGDNGADSRLPLHATTRRGRLPVYHIYSFHLLLSFHMSFNRLWNHSPSMLCSYLYSF